MLMKRLWFEVCNSLELPQLQLDLCLGILHLFKMQRRLAHFILLMSDNVSGEFKVLQFSNIVFYFEGIAV